MRSVTEYKICSVDGSKLYKSKEDKYDCSFSLLNREKRRDPENCNSILDNSLDVEYLINVVYPKHSAEMGGKHILFGPDKKCMSAIINVTFDYPIKKFEHRGNGIWCDSTKNFNDSLLSDHIYIDENGELVAIEVINHGARDKKKYDPVKIPHTDNLGKYFEYDDVAKAYRIVKNTKNDKYTGKKKQAEVKIGTDKSATEIREELYKEKGFDVDGVTYVRYKRSAGSGRDGSCLFIAKPLYDDMMRWSSCGIDENAISDKASWQAYISLTLSAMIDKIELPKESIMLIPDVEIEGDDEVVRVTRGASENGETISLDAKRERISFTNKIWDGEALLDESVFELLEEKLSKKNNQQEPKHGMMLLRNRMFKTCAFRTRLQKYFKDQKIDSVKDLGGYTLAKSVEDVKLVVTESSVKYIKLYREANPSADLEEAFKSWLDVIYKDKNGKNFGIVKMDKRSGPINNYCVYTNYQLLNTLNLNRDQTSALLKDSLDLLHKVQSDSMYLRYQSQILAYAEDDVNRDDECTSLSEYDEYDPSGNYRYELIRELLARSDEATRLDIYTDYRTDLSNSFRNRLKKGRIVVEGNYETLLGNPLEFLRRAANKNYDVTTEPLALKEDEIYTRRFKNNKTLLCARSPHITMGNVLVATNRYVKEIDEYFELGDANTIVCVNAIKSNLQQRLNGCDYDSDTMLITDNPILLEAAKDHKRRFPVPYCSIKMDDIIDSTEDNNSKKSKKEKTLSELDITIANSKVGEIVNLSQFLNCLYWDGVNSKKSDEELETIYNDICKLAVLSGIEIDKAKRDMKVSAAKIINKLQHYRTEFRKADENEGLPQFYVFITNSPKSAESKKARMNAPLSHIWDIVTQDAKDNPAPIIPSEEYATFFGINKTRYNQRAKERSEKLCEIAEELKNSITSHNIKFKKSNKKEHSLFNETIKEKITCALKKADDYLKGDSEYYYTLAHLDDDDRRHLTLLYLLCFANKNNDKCLLNKIRHNDIPMRDLIQDDSIDVNEKSIIIYGHPHRAK